MNYGRRSTHRAPLIQRKDLVDHLKTFTPRCIRPGEDPIEAHRYAAKVELAEYLLRLIEQEDVPDYSYQED